MKILVTGGAGFIGGNFVHYMVNKYPEDMIVNLDKLTYAGNLETCKPVEGKPNYKFVKGDIADREFIFDLFKKEKFDFHAPHCTAPSSPERLESARGPALHGLRVNAAPRLPLVLAHPHRSSSSDGSSRRARRRTRASSLAAPRPNTPTS